MTYQCLGYDSLSNTYAYEITLTVYRDCGPNNSLGTFFDDLAAIGVFQNNSLSEGFSIPYPGFFTTINTEINDPCLENPSSACVQQAQYTRTINLNFDDGPIDITYQRCCRNESINNVIAGGSTGTTLTVHIPVPEAPGVCNSSPVFTGLPPAFVCLNNEVELDFSAQDVDGDSLVYNLCTPFLGANQTVPAPPTPSSPPYTPLSWAGSFNALNPFNASPMVNLDSETGLLTGAPTQTGIFTIGICVSEYRNGSLISTILRDYQIFVYNCPESTQASIAVESVEQSCGGLSITFDNSSINSDAWFWDFGIDSIASDTSNEFEPTFVFPETDIYTVMLIANPGLYCADTTFSDYSVQLPIVPEFNIPQVICSDNGTSFSFEATGIIPDGGIYNWDFDQGVQSNEIAPQNITFPIPGDYFVTLSIENNGCIGIFTDTLTIFPEVSAVIGPQAVGCIGLDLALVNESQNATDYQWTISGNEQQFFSTETTPLISVPLEGLYNIMLVATHENTCPDTAFGAYEAFPLMAPFFEPDQPVFCFNNNAIDFIAGGVYQDFATFNWDFGEGATPVSSFEQNPSGVHFAETGTLPVILTISENNCIKNYIGVVEIHPNPVALFSVLDTIGCKPLLVQFVNLSEAWTPMEYHWTFGDGPLSEQSNPLHPYTISGNYYPSLTVNTTYGCIDENTYTLPNPIVVFPIPQANFVIEPNSVSIEDPTVSVSDLSQNSIDVSYAISNGDLIEEPNFDYTFLNSGYHTITQTVINEFGCTTEVTGGVEVKGFLLYLPDAFSPDGDGKNDVFTSEMTGIQKFEIVIYSRWGREVFRSNDLDWKWDGNNTGAGVFNYIINLTDLINLPHQLSGSVLLIR